MVFIHRPRLLAIRLLFALIFLLSVASLVQCQPATAQVIPIAATKYKALLVRSAHAHWGLDAPIATMAAQVHQESRWRADARSPVGAQGIAQFMPATSRWIAGVYPQSLSNAQPFNPAWALRAMVIYDRSLYKQNQATSTCEQWAMTLAAYNGGQGWVNRDRKLASASGADELAWFNSIEFYNAGRSPANFTENRHYPRAILLQWEPVYSDAGWGSGACRERYTF